MSNPIAALFGAFLVTHAPHAVHHHRPTPVRVVIERAIPARIVAHPATVGTKSGEPLIVSVTDHLADIPLPTGDNFEVDNIGDHPVHLIVEDKSITVAGHQGVFLRSRFSSVSAVMDQGEISIVKVWAIRR